MSPPQVNSSKPEVIFVEKPNMEEGRPEMNKSSRKTCIIASVVLTCVLIISATTFSAIAYSHHLFYKEDYESMTNVDGLKFPEHIKVDYKNEFIYVSNEQSGPIDALNALHNYDRKLLAFLDLTAKKCFLDRLNDTFEEGLRRWSKHASEVERLPIKESFDTPQHPVHPEVLLKLGGEEIVNHCKDVETYWMINIRPYEEKRIEKRALRAVVCCKTCRSSSSYAYA